MVVEKLRVFFASLRMAKSCCSGWQGVSGAKTWPSSRLAVVAPFTSAAFGVVLERVHQ